MNSSKMNVRLIGAALFFLASSAVGPRSEAALLSSLTMDEVQAKLASLPQNGRPKTKAILYSELGTRLYKNGQMTEAATHFEQALGYRTSPSLKRHIYLFLGKSYESSRRADKAIFAYEQAVRYDPKNWRRHRDLGRMHEEVKLYDKALQAYQAAQLLSPRELELILSIGRIRRKQGFFGAAEQELKKLEPLDHQPLSVSEELSFIYEGQGRFNEAAHELIKTLDAQSLPDQWSRLTYLGLLASSRPLAQEGIKHLHGPGGSKETADFYQNLLELMNLTPEQTLSSIATNPAFQALFESLSTETETRAP